MKTIKNFFYRLWYALPFSMKSGEILTTNSTNEDETHIQQLVNKSTLAQDLLKAEVTQEVEELRYQTYTIAEEAKKFKYIGEGVAVRVDTQNRQRINFRQVNKFNVRGVLDELNRVNAKTYGDETYTLNLKHETLPRYKMEKYCTSFEVDISTVETDIKANTFTLFFDNIPNVNEVTSKSFHNELDRIINGVKSELTEIELVSFITFNVNGENDLIKYDLSHLKMISIEKTKTDYVIVYQIESFQREDLTDKFFSASMAKKYEQKSVKNATYDGFNKSSVVRYCSECGKEINAYDYAITTETVGKSLCQDCLTKYLLQTK